MSRDKYNKIVDKVLGKSWLTAYMECNDIATYQKCEVSCYRSGSMLVYHCKTCSKQDDCYICSDCFVPEKHKGHDYVIVEKKHFYCSCGSADKMNSKGFCNKHGYKNNDNVFKLVPKGYNGLAERMEKLIQMCIIAHNVDNTDLFQETVAAILDLTQMPLHFLMLARILSKPLQKQQNSKLVEKCGYTKNNFFFHERLNRFLKVANKEVQKFVTNPRVKQDSLEKLTNFIDAFYTNTPSKPQELKFSSEWLKSLLSLLSISSNFLPFFINNKKKDDESNLSSIEFKLRSLHYINLIAEKTVKMIEVSQLHEMFPQIHSAVMSHINSHLEKVPKAKINGCEVDVRISGVNQPVFPFSVILPFYTQALMIFHDSNLDVDISKEDAFSIFQYVVTSLRFKEQYANNVYDINDSSKQFAYLFYVNGLNKNQAHEELSHNIYNSTNQNSYTNLLYDLTLIHLLANYIDKNLLLTQWGVMFELYKLDAISETDTVELNDQNLNLENSQNLKSFIRSIAEVERRYEVFSHASDKTIFEEFIIHLTAVGITSPTEVYNNFHIEGIPYVKLYNSICEKKGVLNVNSKQKIDPFFPFMANEREILVNNYLISSRQPCYTFSQVKPFTEFRNNSFMFNIVYKFLTFEKVDYDIIPYFLLFLNDGGVIKTECDPLILKKIGENIGKQQKKFVGCGKIINKIGGELNKGFQSIKVEEIIQEDIQEEIPKYENKQEEKPTTTFDENFCVVCQQQITKKKGKFISIKPNALQKDFGLYHVCGCKHSVHAKCYEKLKKKRCPACNFKFTNFLPSVEMIKQGDAYTSLNLLNNLYLEDNTPMELAKVICSVLMSVVQAEEYGYEINQVDIDIVKSMYEALCNLTNFFIMMYLQSNYDAMQYQQCFILYCSAKIPYEEYLSFVKTSLAASFQFITNRHLAGGMDFNTFTKKFIQPLNSFLSHFMSITHPKKKVPSISANDVLIKCRKSPNLPPPEMFTILSKPFNKLPKTYQQLLDTCRPKLCANCGFKPSSYKNSAKCLLCESLICEDEKCLLKHLTKCYDDFSFYIKLSTGEIVLENEVGTFSQVVYFNQYGDKFSYDLAHLMDYSLDEKLFNSVIASFIRGTLLTNN
ncbi:E3 ubiquitin-protein ligase [Entamoeba marina]